MFHHSPRCRKLLQVQLLVNKDLTAQHHECIAGTRQPAFASAATSTTTLYRLCKMGRLELPSPWMRTWSIGVVVIAGADGMIVQLGGRDV